MRQAGQFFRTFIAIELPAPIKDAMREVQAELRKSGADVGWVRPEGVHLTLKFLGDVEEAAVGGLGEALAEALADAAGFSLRTVGTGVFPNAKAPRVVWLGLTGDMKALASLQRRVEAVCNAMGFPPEDRPFKPHLTLGRVKSPRGREALMKALAAYRDADLGEFKADAVSVMKSELKFTGAMYTEMRRIRLM